MNEKNNIDDLIVKYLQQTILDDEKSELSEWVNTSEKNAALFDSVINNNWVDTNLKEIYSIKENSAWDKISAYRFLKKDATDKKKSIIRKPWFRFVAAASIIAVISTTAYLLQPRPETNKQTAVHKIADVSKDVKAPDKNRAAITLSSGKVVYLDSLGSGTQVKQAGVTFVKLDDGQLSYASAPDAQVLVYNSLYNPRGSKTLNLTLSDGTKVWLNNETTLRYPVNFIGNERRVEITGEAYFEVAKMPLKPFKVISGKMEVEVLGTHFNINAYPDEEIIKTTLLEGKVKLHSGQHSKELLPDQQGIFSEKMQDGFMIDPNADIDMAMAWKQEMFQFDNVELPVIMRQIGRWYDRDIVYEKKPGTEKFGGNIGRNVLLSDVLKMLEVNEIHFMITDKAIIVKP